MAILKTNTLARSGNIFEFYVNLSDIRIYFTTF